MTLEDAEHELKRLNAGQASLLWRIPRSSPPRPG
jgi:hypothetical protein